MMRSQEQKRDFGKLRFDLICPLAEHALAMVLTSGADKYEPNGWTRLESEPHRIDASLARHRNALRRGERFDTETALPHVFHLLANAMFLASFEMRRLQREGILDAVTAKWAEEMQRLSLSGKQPQPPAQPETSGAPKPTESGEAAQGSGMAELHGPRKPEVHTTVLPLADRIIGGVRVATQTVHHPSASRDGA